MRWKFGVGVFVLMVATLSLAIRPAFAEKPSRIIDHVDGNVVWASVATEKVTGALTIDENDGNAELQFEFYDRETEESFEGSMILSKEAFTMNGNTAHLYVDASAYLPKGDGVFDITWTRINDTLTKTTGVWRQVNHFPDGSSFVSIINGPGQMYEMSAQGTVGGDPIIGSIGWMGTFQNTYIEISHSQRGK